jgi:hypothetical protein
VPDARRAPPLPRGPRAPVVQADDRQHTRASVKTDDLTAAHLRPILRAAVRDTLDSRQGKPTLAAAHHLLLDPDRHHPPGGSPEPNGKLNWAGYGPGPAATRPGRRPSDLRTWPRSPCCDRRLPERDG